jgi:hypothetical protein
MDIQKILEETNKTLQNCKIEIAEIPNINLYMEQVLGFLNSELDVLKRNPKDKIYTQSMINNYVKSQVLSKPDNKKYTPKHVVELLLIFYLKQILSLDDIKTLFKFSLSNMNLKEFYSSYLKYTSNDYLDISSEINNYINILESDSDIKDDETKALILISLLTAKANTYKMFSEKLIDSLKNDN